GSRPSSRGPFDAEGSAVINYKSEPDRPVSHSAPVSEPVDPGWKAPESATRGPDMNPYIQDAIQKVRSQLPPPQPGASGRCHIKFAVGRDGGVGDLAFLESASPDSANQVVEDAVRKAGPFNPLPEGASSLSMEMTVDYDQTRETPASP